MAEDSLRIDLPTASDSLMVADMRELGVTFSADNSVVLLKSGGEKFEDVLAAIKQAQKSVHLEYFNFRNDSIANLLFDVLAEKAKQGVDVRCIYDAFGNTSNNRPLKNKHINSIRSRGIKIYEFDSLNFPWINHVFHRDHRKIVVIDNKVAYTGGMNVADYYINGTEQVGEWHDMHCRLEGTEVQSLQKIFFKMWYRVTGEVLTEQQVCADTEFVGLKQDITPSKGLQMIGVVNREPRVSNKVMRKMYLAAINNAQDSIKIITPYFTPSRKIRNALKNAVKRGVSVELMLGEKSDIPLTPDCGFNHAYKLMKKGCVVWLFQPGFHHTKVLMADGKYCTLGSANLDARSMRWDYEENLLIIDREITADMTSVFNHDRKYSNKLTKEYWKLFRTPWQRFRGHLASILSPFM